MPASHHRLGVIVNPHASRGRARAHGDRVQQALASAGFTCERVESADPEAAAEQARELSTSVAGFVFVGGDGLLSRMIQVAEVRALPFAIFPAGTGNDFARALGFSNQPNTFASELRRAFTSPIRIDAGTAEHAGGASPHWFVAHLCLGFVARVNARANRSRFPLGSLGYKLALIRELLVGRFDRYRVTRRGATLEGEFLLMTIMNIPLLGGGISLIPSAHPSDGELDVITVTAASRRRIFSVLPLLAAARHEGLPEITITREHDIVIDGPDLELYADGDALGHAPVRVRAHGGELQVWAPTPIAVSQPLQ